MKLYVVAGEISGDSRGAELIRALRQLAPSVEFSGAGGKEMRALTDGAVCDWADEAVVGLWDVLKKYGYFKAQFDRILAEIESLAPKALILIDYPGFNLRLAKAVRARLPGIRIIFYISPQVWAWNRGRIPKMAGWLDLMLCIFPFEQPLYEASGLKAIFVGHPMLDTLASKVIGEIRDSQLVGLFPGSRLKEVRRIFPVMLETAKCIKAADPKIRFEAAAASDAVASLMRDLTLIAGFTHEQCPVVVGSSHSLMQRSAVGMVASGTATLEAAYFSMPLVILYKVAWLTWVIGKQLVKVDFLGMPNLLAGHEIAREFLQYAARPEPIAEQVLYLLHDEPARKQATSDLAAIIQGLGAPGAGLRAATAVCTELGLIEA